MNQKYENHLESALAAAAVVKLPKIKKGPWDGLAIMKVLKINKHEVYCIGRWNSDIKDGVITQDFDNKPKEKFLEAYPFEEEARNLKLAEQKAKEAEMKKKIEAEMREKITIEAQLKEIGFDPQGETLEELKAELIKAQSDKGEADLSDMKTFLSEVGYHDTYVNRLTLEAATKSVEKVKRLQDEVKAKGEEPKTDIKELEAQAKGLSKK